MHRLLDGVARNADVPIPCTIISRHLLGSDRIRYGLSVPPEIFDA
jgi:hypothetical protein